MKSYSVCPDFENLCLKQFILVGAETFSSVAWQTSDSLLLQRFSVAV